jgi:hypothetical protein
VAKTIHKYTLQDVTFLTLQPGAELLHVHEQNGGIRLWVLVDPELPRTVLHQFDVYGTGHVMPNNPGKYIGSVHLQNIRLVFHVFESTEVRR